ncbi:hypothetical protein P152DRAFT_460641 [Eremomyces bilateralis CBS 781.70]|uniref:DNA polymerase delta subunit 3 n=1 Tax=Eremomyces bilateralis CBS 781.70 TaxID=1392243 RepID=A0A6G1FXU0_9PEZI|nr:uncharacterized protein P152DRAFT_460641 [Eremomyces bilateralis CBS 781.70]KAF1810501.1 hypothetical protein P152DRAFT_460641 [Eremomyces bilateralis CBS 781.70]
MAQDYVDYLAGSVLNDRRPVTYRSLSRALKVHVNIAKQMLYEFHRAQNGRQPGSVHATYLISGLRRIDEPAKTNGSHPDGDDVKMADSSFAHSEMSEGPSQQPETLVKAVQVIPEEKLEEIQGLFSTIKSLHLYSLEPNPVKDLDTLSDCNRIARQNGEAEDPLTSWKQYGVIQNPLAIRRTRQNALSSTPSADNRERPSATPRLSQGSVKAGEGSKLSSNSTNSTSTPKPLATKSKPAPKTGSLGSLGRGTSSLSKAFAKAKPKTVPEPVKKTEDEPMMDASEEEDDEAVLFDDHGKSNEDAMKERAARQEALLTMMEDDDDNVEMQDAKPEVDSPASAAPIDSAAESQPEQPSTESPTMEGGKKRSRRRVTKKVTSKDEEGYLVTKEEQVWESFSEDEPDPPKKTKQAPAPPSAKTKKGGPKAGQGNITSFFKKQ